jgi:hypothetical protein
MSSLSSTSPPSSSSTASRLRVGWSFSLAHRAGEKAFVGLDMALSIATGIPWCDRTVLQGPIVYVAGEGIAGLFQRVRAWQSWHAVETVDHAYFLPVGVQLHDPKEVAALLRALRKKGVSPRLIIFDTLARCFVGGEENSAKDMGLLVAGVRRIQDEIGAAVWLPHHPGKNTKQERGSSALSGAADTTILLANAKGGKITLSCDKQKEAPVFEDIPLRLQVVDLPDTRTSCVVVPAGSGPPPRLPQKHRRLLRLLRVGFPRGASFTEWLATSHMPKATFNRLIKDLVGWGFVAKTGAKYLSTPGPEA